MWKLVCFAWKWACRRNTFSYKWFRTKIRFDTEANANSEMAYWWGRNFLQLQKNNSPRRRVYMTKSLALLMTLFMTWQVACTFNILARDSRVQWFPLKVAQLFTFMFIIDFDHTQESGSDASRSPSCQELILLQEKTNSRPWTREWDIDWVFTHPALVNPIQNLLPYFIHQAEDILTGGRFIVTLPSPPRCTQSQLGQVTCTA